MKAIDAQHIKQEDDEPLTFSISKLNSFGSSNLGLMLVMLLEEIASFHGYQNVARGPPKLSNFQIGYGFCKLIFCIASFL